MRKPESDKRNQQSCKRCGRIVGCDYHGRKHKCGCNQKHMGKNMKHALAFARDYPGWHSWDDYCKATKDALCRLEKRGLIRTNNHKQFRLATQ